MVGGELNCTPGKRRGGGGARRECESEGRSPFSIFPSIFFSLLIVNSFSRALLSERPEKATQQAGTGNTLTNF